FFDMVANKFKAVAPNPLNAMQVAGLDNRLIADLVVLSRDALMGNPNVDNRGIIASDMGLFASKLTTVAVDTVMVTNTNNLNFQLQLTGTTHSMAPSNANVYALVTDFDNNNDKLYRYDVPEVTQPPAN